MTFASDAHRKWWFANHGMSTGGGGGGVGGSGVSFPDLDAAMQAAQDLEDAKHYADNPAAAARRDIKESEKSEEYRAMTGGGGGGVPTFEYMSAHDKYVANAARFDAEIEEGRIYKSDGSLK